MNRSSFQTQLRRSFIGYVVVIISVTLVLYLGGYALNFYTGVIVENQENNRAMADTLADQYRNYEEGSDALARCPETRAVLTQNSVGATADLNRILYQFVNEQDFRAYFVLMTPERQVVCSNFCISLPTPPLWEVSFPGSSAPRTRPLPSSAPPP